MDVVGTLRASVALVNAQSARPDFLLHTGDLTHLSKSEEFDTLAGVMQESHARKVFYVPGEHDVIGDNGSEFFRRFGERQHAGGWYSFDHRGVHFVGLINVLNLKADGLGSLGTGATGLAEKGSRRTIRRNALGDICPHAAMAVVPIVGLGYG